MLKKNTGASERMWKVLLNWVVGGWNRGFIKIKNCIYFPLDSRCLRFGSSDKANERTLELLDNSINQYGCFIDFQRNVTLTMFLGSLNPTHKNFNTTKHDPSTWQVYNLVLVLHIKKLKNLYIKQLCNVNQKLKGWECFIRTLSMIYLSLCEDLSFLTLLQARSEAGHDVLLRSDHLNYLLVTLYPHTLQRTPGEKGVHQRMVFTFFKDTTRGKPLLISTTGFPKGNEVCWESGGCVTFAYGNVRLWELIRLKPRDGRMTARWRNDSHGIYVRSANTASAQTVDPDTWPSHGYMFEEVSPQRRLEIIIAAVTLTFSLSTWRRLNYRTITPQVRVKLKTITRMKYKHEMIKTGINRSLLW